MRPAIAGGDGERAARKHHTELRRERGSSIARAPGERSRPGYERRDKGGRCSPDGAACPMQQLPQRGGSDPELGRQLRPTATMHRNAEQDPSLALRQRIELGQRSLERDPPLDRRLQTLAPDERLGELLALFTPTSQRIKARVAGNEVEPGADVSHLGARSERSPRLEEDLLDAVLCGGVPQYPAAVPKQRRAKAPDDHLKGTLIALSSEGRQPVVGRDLQRHIREGRFQERFQ